MLLVVSATVGLVVWIVLWAVGFKSFDAFLITMLIMIVAVTVRIVLPYLPGRRERPSASPGRQ
jgi:hypothetical protein